MKKENLVLRIALGAVGGMSGTVAIFSAPAANKKLAPETEAPMRQDPGEFVVETAEDATLKKSEQKEVPRIAETIAARRSAYRLRRVGRRALRAAASAVGESRS